MKRRVLRGSLILVALLAAAVIVIATSSGVARYVVNRGAAAVPGLSLRYADGNLWNGVGVAALRYESAGLQVAAERMVVRWSWECLASGSLCLDRVSVDDAAVEIRPVAGGNEPSNSAGSMPVLPLDIVFRTIELNRVRVYSPGAQVAVARVEVRGNLSNAGLRIAAARIVEPVIELPAQQSGAADESARPTPIELPPIRSPLAVDVAQLRIEGPVLQAAERRNEARSVRFEGALDGADLVIRRLEVEHARGRAEVSGRLRLVDDYPLDLRIQGAAPALYRNRAQRLDANLSGSVADLGVKAQLGGLVDATLDGQLEPLRPEIPYSLTVRTPGIGWPLGEANQQVRGTDVRLRLKGDLSGYTLSGNGGLTGTETPQLDWRIDANGDWAKARIERLALRGLDGGARVAGDVSWSPAVTWRGSVEADGLRLSRLWPQAPDDIAGAADVSGEVTAGGWQLAVDTSGVDATYRGERVTVAGTLRHTPAGVWQFPGLRVANGANRVSASGSVDGGIAVTATVELPEPGRWLPGIGGSLSGTVAVNGSLAAPDIEFDLRGEGVTYQDLRIAEAKLSGQVERLGQGNSRVAARIGGAAYGAQQLDNLRLVLSGTRARHDLTLQASGEGAAVDLSFSGGLTEAYDWDGRLAAGSIAWQERRWDLQAPASLYFDTDALEARMSEHCWARDATRICLNEPALLGRRGEVAVSLSDMPLGWLSQWLPEGFKWRGRLTGDIDADWAPDRAPRVEATLISREGSLTVASGEAAAEGDAALPLGYETLRVDAQLDPEVLRAKVDLQSTTLGNATVNVRLRHAAPGRPMSGDLEVEGVNLAVFEPFFPRIEKLKGTAAAAGRLGGNLTSPTFDGEVSLNDGEIQGPELPMHVEDLSLGVRVSGRQLRMSGGFRSGDGTAKVTGDGAWDADGWRLDARLTGERLRVQYVPLAVLQVSPDLRLKADPGDVVLTGTIRVPEGDLTLKQLPKGAVPYSTDVVIVRGPGARGEDDESGPNGPRINTRIEVVLGDAVRFSGLGAEGRLTGGLQLRQVGAATAEGSGEIRIVDASFEAYGQKLDIRSGRLIFAGPVTEPLVEIEAVRRVDTVVVGIRVEGPAAEPDVSLFSEPQMPEEQILAYLVTGRAYGEAGPGEDAAMAQAAVALGVFTSRGAASDIASELGVQDFQLAAEGEGEAAQVTVSGYIAPNLLVKYGVGVFTPHNSLTLRYNVTRNIYLEAVSGLESAIDAFYTFSF